MFNYESAGGTTNSDIHHSPVSVLLGQGEGENHSAQNRRLSTPESSTAPSCIHFNPIAIHIDHEIGNGRLSCKQEHACKKAKLKDAQANRLQPKALKVKWQRITSPRGGGGKGEGGKGEVSPLQPISQLEAQQGALWEYAGLM
ncbi:hypothetical protein Q8A67_023943 [Cirrhinus molitorella]|uniref:Uncharacterized protein n=1 Tax=Cirrhinus molitorella TaxID=172907 RepID=A0AA88TBN6_9TELE|nr:hypothetical protein Q8A67_023943 [Cirrhinus molitorella]